MTVINNLNSLDLNNIPTRPVIQTGRVLYSNPSIGYYEILPDNRPNGLDGTIQAFDVNTFSHYGSGVSVTNAYPTGTPVFYYSFETNFGDPLQRSQAIILGADKQIPLMGSVRFPSFTIGNDEYAISSKLDTVSNAFIEIQSTNSIKDRAYGAASDLCPGEYLVSGALKNNIYVGYGVTSISGGYNNNLTFFTESNGCVFSSGNYFIKDTIIGREEAYPDYAKDITFVSQKAYNTYEGFGCLSDEPGPFKNNTEDGEQVYTKQETGQFPVFRLQELAGAICQGEFKSVAGVIQKDQVFNVTNSEKDILKAGILDRNEETEQPKSIQYALSTIRRPWDGSVSVNSLHSVTLDKDYYIPYASQIATEANTTLEDPQDVPEVIADTYSKITGDLFAYATQGASALYEYSKLGVVRRFLTRARQRIKAWKIWPFKDVAKELNITEKKIPQLSPGLPCYVSNLTPIDDPITKGKSLIEALSAFVHISQSGAIVISDGYGAEIRLEGGNITLSPAGDLRILPGRDVIGIVPGKTEYVSKDRIDLASDTKEVTIKADKACQVISRLDVVELESMSTKTLVYDEEEKAWAGAGIILKSGSDVSVTGTNINIRRQLAKDESNGRAATGTAGSILIDSNDGPLCMYGSDLFLRGESNVTIGGSNSAVTVGKAFQVASSLITLPGTVNIGGGLSISIPMPKITGKNTSGEAVYISMGDGALTVDGPVAVTKGILASKAEFDQLGVNAARIVRGAIDNAGVLSGLKTPADAESLDIPLETLDEVHTSFVELVSGFVDTVSASTTRIVEILATLPVYKAKTIKAVDLVYPSTEDYKATEFFIVPSRWQRHLEGSTNWGKPRTVNDSMIFPGIDKWTKDDCVYQIVAKGYSKDYTYNDMFDVSEEITYSMEPEGSLSQAYKINAQEG